MHFISRRGGILDPIGIKNQAQRGKDESQIHPLQYFETSSRLG